MQEQFRGESEADRMVSLRNEMQMLLADAEHTGDEGLREWVRKYKDDFKRLVEHDSTLLDKFENANEEERRLILEEVKKEIYH